MCTVFARSQKPINLIRFCNLFLISFISFFGEIYFQKTFENEFFGWKKRSEGVEKCLLIEFVWFRFFMTFFFSPEGRADWSTRARTKPNRVDVFLSCQLGKGFFFTRRAFSMEQPRPACLKSKPPWDQTANVRTKVFLFSSGYVMQLQPDNILNPRKSHTILCLNSFFPTF